MNKKKELFTLLDDDDSGIKWKVKNTNFEDFLHIICYLSNIFSKDDIIRLIEIIKKHGLLNPLNRDDVDKTAIDVFKLKNQMPKEDENEILNLLNEIVKETTIEVNNYIESERNEIISNFHKN